MSRLENPESKSADYSDIDLDVDLLPFTLLNGVKASDCFGLMEAEHDLHGSLCMSRDRDFISPTETFVEFVRASFVLGRIGRSWSWGQPFWYCVRQTMELGLKTEIEKVSGTWPTNLGHDLRGLLSKLQASDPAHPIVENRELADFILRMHEVDPTGDGGRFQRHKGGRHALAEVCCMDAEKTLFFVDAMNLIVVPRDELTVPVTPVEHRSGQP